jgi:carboxylate-amine ligase
MSQLPNFKQNNTMTMGIELELQLVNLHHFNLAMEAQDFLRRLSEMKLPIEIKPEITQSMIEINSSPHSSYNSLLTEIKQIRDILVDEASKTFIGICGGGIHPFQRWYEQRIYQTERFAKLSEQYGYLAKQFTVFGQHIHVACPNGDDALYLCHAIARFIPHFIALSAASPYTQGIDTSFDCSRLAVISAFPLSGTPPWLHQWTEFEDYYQRMAALGIISSMKDFYWDIRPKPEFGTVELRVCDTPLTVETACHLAAYMHLLCEWLLAKRPPLSRDIYITYLINRFRASRYGLDAVIVDPVANKQIPLAEDILKTCLELEYHASSSDSSLALSHIKAAALHHTNGSKWLRKMYKQYDSLNDVVREQVVLWKI